MMSGRMVLGAGDARILPSMAKCYLRKIRSRHPGFANFSDTPAPNTIRPAITRHDSGASTIAALVLTQTEWWEAASGRRGLKEICGRVYRAKRGHSSGWREQIFWK